jgi:hypothetical protein
MKPQVIILKCYVMVREVPFTYSVEREINLDQNLISKQQTPFIVSNSRKLLSLNFSYGII